MENQGLLPREHESRYQLSKWSDAIAPKYYPLVACAPFLRFYRTRGVLSPTKYGSTRWQGESLLAADSPMFSLESIHFEVYF